MKKFGLFLVLGVFAFSAVVAPLSIVSAQTTTGGAPANIANCDSVDYGIAKTMCFIAYYINAAIPILIALAVLYFIWGVIQYVIGGDEESKGKGRTMMIYGLIGVLAIVTLWGLVSFLRNSFGISSQSENIMVPCITGAGVVC